MMPSDVLKDPKCYVLLNPKGDFSSMKHVDDVEKEHGYLFFKKPYNKAGFPRVRLELPSMRVKNLDSARAEMGLFVQSILSSESGEGLDSTAWKEGYLVGCTMLSRGYTLGRVTEFKYKKGIVFHIKTEGNRFEIMKRAKRKDFTTISEECQIKVINENVNSWSTPRLMVKKSLRDILEQVHGKSRTKADHPKEELEQAGKRQKPEAPVGYFDPPKSIYGASVVPTAPTLAILHCEHHDDESKCYREEPVRSIGEPYTAE